MQHLNFLYFFFIANMLKLFYVGALTEIPEEHRVMIDHHPYRILGIGHACMDLLIPVSEEFLAHIAGEKGGCQRIEIEKLNHIIAISKKEPHLATGGSCANTIKGLASLGEKCAFFSHVGMDALGEHFTEYMKQLNILTLFSQSIHPTARVLCLVTPDGQRTMRFAGNTESMNEKTLHPDYFKGVKLMHIEAYPLHNGNLVESAMKLAKQAETKISMDLSSSEIIRQFHGNLTELLTRYVDIVFANQDETKSLTGTEDAFEGCLKLQEMCSVAVVLMGGNGCLVGHQGKVFHSPAFAANVVDSTGAGDLFASGFLHGYLQGYALPKCAKMGNRLGSAVIEVQGAEIPFEKWKEIRALLHEQEN